MGRSLYCILRPSRFRSQADSIPNVVFASILWPISGISFSFFFFCVKKKEQEIPRLWSGQEKHVWPGSHSVRLTFGSMGHTTASRVCVSVTIAANVSSHEANRRTRVPEVSHQRFSPTRCVFWSFCPIALFPLFLFLILILIPISIILVLDDLILPGMHITIT